MCLLIPRLFTRTLRALRAIAKEMAALDVREPREEVEERSGSEVIGVEAVNVQIELEESEAGWSSS